jgi:hypothetical protein
MFALIVGSILIVCGLALGAYALNEMRKTDRNEKLIAEKLAWRCWV